MPTLDQMLTAAVILAALSSRLIAGVLVATDADPCDDVDRPEVILVGRCAREGIVIWVPPGDASDPARDPERLNRTAALPQDAGLPMLT